MKVLQINDFYNVAGGTEKTLVLTAEYLEKEGCEVVIIYTRKRPDTVHCPGRSEYHIPQLALNLNDPFRMFGNSSALALLANIVQKEDPDVIHVRNVDNPAVLRLLHQLRPVVKTIHAHNPYCPAGSRFLRRVETECGRRFGVACLFVCGRYKCIEGWPSSILRRYELVRRGIKMNQKLDRLIVTSEYMKENLLQNGFDKKKIEVLPPFINVDQISKRESTPDDKNVVLYVGRMNREKGVACLIRAFQHILLPSRLVLVGDGPELDTYKELVDRLDMTGRVRFVGWISSNRVGKYYARSSLVVVPSLWPEPFGQVGIEAMSYSRPVVAFNVGGIREWLEDGQTGFLIKPRDTKEMVLRIELLLKDRKLRERLGRTGHHKALTEYSASKHMKKLLGIYRSARDRRR